MRAFIAIDIPEEIRKGISGVSAEVAMPGIVLVKPEVMHITMQFLGEIDEHTLKNVIAALDQLDFESFNVSLRGIGYFSPDFIRVLFVSLSEGEKKLKALYDSIGSLLASKGVGFDGNDYTPHVTIARAKYLKDKTSIIKFVERYKTYDFGSFTVGNVKLKESVLGSSGPAYTDLYSKALMP